MFIGGYLLMTPIESDRSLFASFLLRDTPLLIRERLLQDATFLKNTGVVGHSQISFSGSLSSFQLDKFYAACRSALDSGESVGLSDNSGQSWFVDLEANEKENAHLILSKDGNLISLSDFSVLSSNSKIRLDCLLKASLYANLPQTSYDQWRAILEQQPFDDVQLDTYLNDLYDTPVHFIASIKRLINMTNVSISQSMLVPDSSRYYERLVGIYDSSDNILEYSDRTAKIFFNNILQWPSRDRLQFCLFLSSHSSLPAAINVEQIDDEELLYTFGVLAKRGDLFSRLGALELGLAIVDQRPKLEPLLLLLARSLLENVQQVNFCEYHLFSSLFVLVDGTIANNHLFVDKPPFYRRLAALAHAAILHCEFLKSHIDLSHFSDWANHVGEEYFKVQTFMDMRLEPRWHPGLASKEQFKAQVIVRMLISGRKYSASLSDGELRNLFGDNPPEQITKISSDVRIFYPGPLAGRVDSLSLLPDKAAHLIKEKLQFDNNENSVDAFVPLVNYSTLFIIDSSFADLASIALGKFKLTLTGLVDKNQLLEILFGLAFVAADCRHKNLACDVRNIVLRYRHNQQYRLNIEEVTAILLVASAASQGVKEWREFTGGWITDLAFGSLIDNEAKVLYENNLLLIDLDPGLWCYCSKAMAAASALCFV